MSDPVLQILTQTVFCVAFVLAAADWVRRGGLARFEVAALFGCLIPVIILQFASGLLPEPPEWLRLLAVCAFVVHPYVLTRLLAQFRPVAPYQTGLAALAVLGCWLALLRGPDQLSAGEVAAVALVFGAAEAYAAAGFVRTARTSRGITHARLVYIALGSGCLGGAVVLAGLASAAPREQWIIQPVSSLFALGSALGYSAGFATPRWLRRVWQRAEVERFLLGLSGFSGQARVATALEYLGPAAARATDGLWASVDQSPGPDAPLLLRAWSEQKAHASTRRTEWGTRLRQVADELGTVRLALVAPLVANGHLHGLFVVLSERRSPFVDDDLAVLGVLAEQAALALDELRLEEENARERTILSAVMSSMHDGLVVLDESGAVRYSNARANELVDITDRALIAETITASHPVELNMVGPPRRDLLLHSFEVTDPQGLRRGTGIVLRDVTVERELLRTKDELVSVVSHELRTPLASVVGFAELLRTRELPESQRQQFLTVIAEEGRRLTALINDFLDLQRMESGRQEINPRPRSAREVIEHAVTAAGEDPIRPIHVSVPRGLPLVRIDWNAIQQVLTNLISNARKYSPHGGEVEITAVEADGQVTIEVKDHGLGIPPEAQSHLFQKFYRVDNSDRRQIKGTGLGLTISRKIVEAHGGRIWAESSGLNDGSRFSFTLPVADVRGTSGEVLIVEDDAGFARLLAAELDAAEFSTVLVGSVEEALDQVARERPRAIVLDLLLPGLQGEVFLQRLREQPGGDIPVVVVTVKDLDTTEQAVLEELGVRAVLRKGAGVGAAAVKLIQQALVQSTAAPEGIAA